SELAPSFIAPPLTAPVRSLAIDGRGGYDLAVVEVAASAATVQEGAPPAAIERPDFEIVPRKGLVIVAIVLAMLITAIAVNKFWPLMFLHVSAGAAWTIIDLRSEDTRLNSSHLVISYAVFCL